MLESLRQKIRLSLNKAHPSDVLGAPEMIQMGVVKRGDDWIFCHPEARIRGVKLITVSPDFIARYNASAERWSGIQDDLHLMRKSLRPRRSRKAPVLKNSGAGVLIEGTEK